MHLKGQPYSLLHNPPPLDLQISIVSSQHPKEKMRTNTLHLLLILGSLLYYDVLAQPCQTEPCHTLAAPTLLLTRKNLSLHTITLNGGEHYIIDLDAPFTWFQCNPYAYQPQAGCNDGACSAGRSYIPPSCPVSNTYTDSQCYCNVAAVNPITNFCVPSALTYKDIVLSWTDGRSLRSSMDFNGLAASCVPPSLFQALPKEVSGVCALSWSSLSLVNEVTGARKFALCLPSSSEARGLIFFGDGPYYFGPSADFDAEKVLTYTPLQGDSASLGYYINLTGISINGKDMNVPRNTFNFNHSAKLSTIVPYTKLKSNIYKTFISAFQKAAKGIVQATSVDPFHLCFTTRSSNNGSLIPQIDLKLGNGKKWTIHPSNLIKQVNDKVACLAFVDGGKKAEQAVVIGTYQMEDNLLQFDLNQSRLGFSSSLLPYGSNCGGFNFTVGGIL